jgi:hypothetical protein
VPLNTVVWLELFVSPTRTGVPVELSAAVAATPRITSVSDATRSMMEPPWTVKSYIFGPDVAPRYSQRSSFSSASTPKDCLGRANGPGAIWRVSFRATERYSRESRLKGAGMKKLVVATVVAIAVLGGTAAAATTTKVFDQSVRINGGLGVGQLVDAGSNSIDPTTHTPIDAVKSEGNVRIQNAELVYGNETTIPAGTKVAKIQAVNVYGWYHFEPGTDVLATIQSGGRNLSIAFARVVSDRYVEIGLTGVPKAPVRVAYMVTVVNRSF